jgi:hypothetical protein
MAGVKNIPGAPRGIYRDGGVIDYHFNIPFVRDEESVVLFPHFMDRIIPSWFDKRLPWRGPSGTCLENVVLLCPSDAFKNRLPLGRIPDKGDFWFFRGRDDERSLCWKKVAQEGERLAEEFLNLVENGKIRQEVRPLCC